MAGRRLGETETTPARGLERRIPFPGDGALHGLDRSLPRRPAGGFTELLDHLESGAGEGCGARRIGRG